MDPSTRRNKTIVFSFLLIVMGFTAMMTFYAGPRMMKLRKEVRNKQLLYKCQKIISGDTIVVQQRGWDKPNTNAMILVKLAGIDAPPYASEQAPDTIAYSTEHKLTPERSARIGKSARNALAAFVRKQNLTLQHPDRSDVLPADGTNIVAHVFVFGSDAGNKQLQNGLAIHQPETAQAFNTVYSESAETAQTRQRGIWQK